MSTNKSELSVITKAKALSEYVLTVTEKSPKRYRFTLVTRLQNYSLDVIETLISANEIYVSAPDSDEAKERLRLQRKSMTSLKLLGYISEVALKHECILPKHYEQITKQIYDVQNLLGAWMNSDKKRFTKDKTEQ